MKTKQFFLRVLLVFLCLANASWGIQAKAQTQTDECDGSFQPTFYNASYHSEKPFDQAEKEGFYALEDLARPTGSITYWINGVREVHITAYARQASFASRQGADWIRGYGAFNMGSKQYPLYFDPIQRRLLTFDYDKTFLCQPLEDSYQFVPVLDMGNIGTQKLRYGLDISFSTDGVLFAKGEPTLHVRRVETAPVLYEQGYSLQMPQTAVAVRIELSYANSLRASTGEILANSREVPLKIARVRFESDALSSSSEESLPEESSSASPSSSSSSSSSSGSSSGGALPLPSSSGSSSGVLYPQEASSSQKSSSDTSHKPEPQKKLEKESGSAGRAAPVKSRTRTSSAAYAAPSSTGDGDQKPYSSASPASNSTSSESVEDTYSESDAPTQTTQVGSPYPDVGETQYLEGNSSTPYFVILYIMILLPLFLLVYYIIKKKRK